MRIRIPTLTVVALFVSFAAAACHAMDLRHYDLHSLAYLSTDIVIANLSQQDDHTIVATVTETLYGSLHAGERLDKLTPFLTFFAPMEDNMRVILFLDRRPHEYDFFHSDASKSPFAIPPSGVYLIDEYEHVHEYYQHDNPGPYVAQGYWFSVKKSAPSKEQDLALPSLAEVRSWIAAAIRVVEPVRPLLDKVAARKDAHALLHLADLTSRNDQDCDLRRADAVHERVIGQIDSLNDAGLFLKAYALGGARQSWAYPLNFIKSSGTNAEQSARVQYLIQTLSNKKQDLALRIVSVNFLLDLSRYHNGPQSGPSRFLPIDNQWLTSSADKIQTTSKAIFDDDSEDPQLRGLCLGFLSLDHPEIVADVKSVYTRTRSSQLRFAIEISFLVVSEALYQSLNPPGGPVTSLITEMPASGCAKKPSTGIGFRMDSQEQTASASFTGRQFVMTNLRTGQRSIRDTKPGYGSSGTQERHFEFELSSLSDLPAGDYSLAMETMQGNKVLSTSYDLRLTVHDTHNGKELLLSKSKEK